MTYEVRVVCDAEAHGEPVPIDLFVWKDEEEIAAIVEKAAAVGEKLDPDGLRGWLWESTRKMGGGRVDPQTRLRLWYDKVTHETYYKHDGREKVSLRCRKCGLYLPMRWERWERVLDGYRHAGRETLSLPALVATLTM